MRSAECHFCCTSFVYYECLHKPRKNHASEDVELQDRFRGVHARREIEAFDLDVEDLQEVIVLERRRKVSKGELSSIAFAKKTSQAFLTDDQGARRLREEILGQPKVQTVLHLFGWLVFSSRLGDSDKEPIITEHRSLKRPLGELFEDMYLEALRCRLMVNLPRDPTSAASVEHGSDQ